MKQRKEKNMAKKPKKKTLGQLFREKLFALPKKPTLHDRLQWLIHVESHPKHRG